MRKNKGITLIALVITIIVLLILAGVSIAMLLGENGILNQAQKAKVETRGATVEEECNLWKMNQKMDAEATEGTAQTLQELLDSLEKRNLITAEERATIETTKKITIGERTINFYKEEEQAKVGVKVTGGNKPYTNKGTAIIPEGFTIVPGCEDVSEGLVISDNEKDTEEAGKPQIAEGNQFVWVPVENFNEFKRELGYYNGALQSGEFVSDAMSNGKYYEPKGDGDIVDAEGTTTEKEAQDMYKSVKENKGFYIGRYESGTTDTNTSNTGIREKMVCKKGATIYNNIKWGTSMSNETGGAVEVSRGFATQENYTSVKSTLCYGVQWDAAIRWMKDIKNPNAVVEDVSKKYYIIDSTKMGWYKDNHSEGNPTLTTGIDIEPGENNKSNKVKNIYDMAGNVREWTMEANGTDKRVSRGGYYFNDAGGGLPASYREYIIPSYLEISFGFRTALYLNVE